MNLPAVFLHVPSHLMRRLSPSRQRDQSDSAKLKRCVDQLKLGPRRRRPGQVPARHLSSTKRDLKRDFEMDVDAAVGPHTPPIPREGGSGRERKRERERERERKREREKERAHRLTREREGWREREREKAGPTVHPPLHSQAGRRRLIL